MPIFIYIRQILYLAKIILDFPLEKNGAIPSNSVV